MSKQALSQRFNSLPSHLFLGLFEQVIERIATKNRNTQLASKWASVAEKFSAVWIADASTLEAIKKHLGQLRGCFKSPGRYNFTVLTWVNFNTKLRFQRCSEILGCAHFESKRPF